MSDKLDILRSYLAPDFKDVEASGEYFTACFYIRGRVASMHEEDKCIDRIKKIGGRNISIIVRAVGLTKFKFHYDI